MKSTLVSMEDQGMKEVKRGDHLGKVEDAICHARGPQGHVLNYIAMGRVDLCQDWLW